MSKLKMSRYLGYSSLICLLLTLFWLLLFLLDTYNQETIVQLEDLKKNLMQIKWTFYAAYINAGLLTLAVPAFLVGLYFQHKETFPYASLLALIYLPVYVGLNVFSYFSQPVFIPEVMSRISSNYNDNIFNEQLAILTHMWPFSLTAFTNSLAYAIVGVPSLIFGVINLNEKPTLRLAGSLLGMSGLASIIGFAGIIFKNRFLIDGTVVGGILFLLSLFMFSYFYLCPKTSAKDVSWN
jgi:hypothetical protein